MKKLVPCAALAVLMVALDIAPSRVGHPPSVSARECAGCEQSVQRSNVRSFEPGPREMPLEFRDDDDDSSIPYMLSSAELQRLGMKPLSNVGFGTVKSPQRRPKLRRLPVLKVRIHAIRTANADGSEAATITPEQVGQLVTQANLVWWSTGIEFQYDPTADFEHRNATELNQDSSHDAFEANVTNANWDPGTADTSPNKAARTNAGNQYPKKLVVFFRYGTKYTWDAAGGRWTRGPGSGGFSSSKAMYVAMPRAMPEKNLLAHELGHYMTIPHTHVGGVDTVDKARQAIKDWVDVHGNSTKTALDALNGDRKVVSDTAADASGAIFVNTYGAGANCAANHPVLNIGVKFDSGYAAYYKLQPDKLNIMSYFKHCHALGTHHLSPAQTARARAVLQSGHRKVLIG